MIELEFFQLGKRNDQSVIRRFDIYTRPEKLMEKPPGVNRETKGPGWKIAQTRNSRRAA